ncbi:MAG: insulinase family protein [Myxococcales bacterium]|nr:insulinase family protein [Myxococcales bacterium]
MLRGTGAVRISLTRGRPGRRRETGRLGAAAVLLALGLAPGAAALARASVVRTLGPSPSTAEPEPVEGEDHEPTPTEVEPSPEPTTTLAESEVDGPTLQDGVLPCGLRVIIAQDESLPVAAVVLAIDTGTEDDPATQPGLVHALAYHLMQGNRELVPGGAVALVHDRGGLASLAVGPAQVRYESLVPISALGDALWVESQRLRAPTVSEELWSSTLRWARRDKSQTWRVPHEAMASAHGAPGLAHDGRRVGSELHQMVPRAIGQALAERFRYDLATLVVVSPHRPPELRREIEALFADLPDKPRASRDRSPRWRTGSVPQAVPIAGEKGQRFVWPVAPDPASVGWATVWCKAINRQRRLPAEPARARLRCHVDLDPRRSTMVLVATGADDPTALVRTRIERIEQGEDDALMERQREVVHGEWIQSLRMPLPLAQRLAAAAPRPSPEPGWRRRPLRWLTGEAALDQPWTPGTEQAEHLELGAAIHLVTPEPATHSTTSPEAEP